MAQVILESMRHPSHDEVNKFIDRAALSTRSWPLLCLLREQDDVKKNRGRMFLHLFVSWSLVGEKRTASVFCNLKKVVVSLPIDCQQDADVFWKNVIAYHETEWPKVLKTHAEFKKVSKEMNAVITEARHKFDAVLKSTYRQSATEASYGH
jgi:hypothetical protein